MKQVGEFFVSLVVSVFGVLIGGFVFMKLWGWFINPLGVTDLTLAQAIGLAYVYHYLNLKKKDLLKEDEKDFTTQIIERIAVIIIANPLVLLIGWIISLFL